MKRTLILGIGVCFSLLAFAETSTSKASPKEKEEKLTPILSPTGIKRIQENIKTLDQNIRDAQVNVSTCEKNLKVLQGELDELAGLEKEHAELKQKLIQYQDVAKGKVQKNKEEIVKINKAVKDVEATPRIEGDGPRRSQLLDKLRNDESELNRWKGDADEKMRRVSEMMREMVTSLTDISQRRNAIRGDIEVWTRRKSDYEKLLVQYRQKKADNEALIKASSRSDN